MDAEQVELETKLIAAVLYVPYAEEAYGGRETAGESMELDAAQDRRAVALDALVEFGARQERVRLMREVQKQLGPALADMERKKVLFAAPYSSHDTEIDYHESRGVPRGLGRALEVMEATTTTRST